MFIKEVRWTAVTSVTPWYLYLLKFLVMCNTLNHCYLVHILVTPIIYRISSKILKGLEYVLANFWPVAYPRETWFSKNPNIYIYISTVVVAWHSLCEMNQHSLTLFSLLGFSLLCYVSFFLLSYGYLIFLAWWYSELALFCKSLEGLWQWQSCGPNR